jgi:hypothetical protein
LINPLIDRGLEEIINPKYNAIRPRIAGNATGAPGSSPMAKHHRLIRRPGKAVEKPQTDNTATGGTTQSNAKAKPRLVKNSPVSSK